MIFLYFEQGFDQMSCCWESFIDHLVLWLYLVKVAVKAREVSVTGPKGSLQRSFKHLAVDVAVAEDGKSLKVDLWFGNRESIAAIRYLHQPNIAHEHGVNIW